MEYKVRTEKVGRSKAIPIMEIVFDIATIYVLEGSRGQHKELDLFIKYSNKESYKQKKKIKYVSPKHIHWATDLLIKKEHSKRMTIRFTALLIEKYKIFVKNNPLKKRTYNDLVTFIDSNIPNNLNNFNPLNKYGIYKIDFLYTLLLLLATNEINSNKNAHMYLDTLSFLADSKATLFDVVTSATDGGFRYGK